MSKNFLTSKYRRLFNRYSPVMRTYAYYFSGNKKQYSRELIKEYLGSELSEKEIRSHIRMMREAYIFYAWTFDEYFFYHFYQHSRAERKAFIVDTERYQFYRKVNSQEAYDIFTNKGLTYQKYGKYFKREILDATNIHDSLDKLHDFITRHPDFILKPLAVGGGEGIQIFHHISLDEFDKIIAEYDKGIILEELIPQSPEMGIFHPQSVNTLRMATFVTNGDIHIFLPTARFGRGDSVIDNVSKGGLSCAIDINTGKITAAFDEVGHKFTTHPDNGKQIIGYQIPQWEEAVRLTKELAMVNPQYRYVGWDLAHTPDGWVLVEGNAWAQFIGYQLPTQKGIRSELLAADPDCLKY